MFVQKVLSSGIVRAAGTAESTHYDHKPTAEQEEDGALPAVWPFQGDDVVYKNEKKYFFLLHPL